MCKHICSLRDPWAEDRLRRPTGHIITSQGPGTSLQFALKIVESLYGLEKAEEIAKVRGPPTHLRVSRLRAIHILAPAKGEIIPTGT